MRFGKTEIVFWTLLAGSMAAVIGKHAFAGQSDNSNGNNLSSVTTINLALGCSEQPGGHNVTLAVSPLASKLSKNPNKMKIVIGPAAVVRRVATVARAGQWHAYE